MVFVTGGTGFIGSYLIYYLLKDNPEIKALKRENSDLKYIKFIFKHLSPFEPMPNGESWEQAFERIEWVDGDILDVNSILDALQDVDIVYHAAALVSYNQKKRDKIIETNVIGTANIVNACLQKGIKKLAYLSSVAALPRNDEEKVDETATPGDFKFNNAYSESKYRAEMEVWRGQAEGLDVTIINPGIVLGWGDFTNSSPEMFNTIYKGLKVYPTGSTSFIDVRDVAKALIVLANNEDALNKRFIAITETISYKRLFDMMAAQFQVKPPSIRVQPGLVKLVWIFAEIKALVTGGQQFVTKDMAVSSGKNLIFDGSRLKEFLGYDFIPIERTVKDTCKVYLKSITELSHLNATF